MLAFNFSKKALEAGTDEAGRGCLAGPVVAAAVICPDFELISKFNQKKSKLSSELLQKNVNCDLFLNLINDSKKLSEKNRFFLRPLIEEIAISFSVTPIYEAVIDEINILNASLMAMQESILKLDPCPEFVIVDGNRDLISKKGLNITNKRIFNENEIAILESIPSESIVKGDSKYVSIAAASVLAKTYRDDYMNKIHKEFPMYNWKQNKGYPTIEHREAIRKYGVTKYHRLTFNGCRL